MNRWTPPQLLELAIQSLLRDEASAVQALNELPIDLFPLVLTVAFRGKQRKVLRALVQAWPFPQLCLAPLLVDPASCQDSLWAVLDGLDARPARGVPSRKSNLKVVDFRPYFELIQSNDSSKDAARSLSSFATWMEPEVTLPETKPRQRRSWKQPWKAWQPVDLYINLSLGTFHGREFFSGVLRKVKQSYRPLRLFCRKLHVRDMPVLRIVEILNLLQLEFIQELEMSGCFGLLSGGSKFASQVEQMKNLCSLTLSHPIFGTSSAESQLPSEAFISFLSHLSKLGCLRMLHLSSEDISGHLHHLFRYLPGSLETLELPSCVLLNTDLCSLSRSPLASHLKKLDLSNNDLSHIASGVLGALLRGASGTLQELLLKNCNMRDIHLLAILPALSCCFHLHSLSLCGNHIWESSLTHLIQLVAGLSELKLLVCPLPVECYKYVQSTALYCLQPQQFICVKTMVQERLRALGRENLEWTFTLPTLWCWGCQSI